MEPPTRVGVKGELVVTRSPTGEPTDHATVGTPAAHGAAMTTPSRIVAALALVLVGAGLGRWTAPTAEAPAAEVMAPRPPPAWRASLAAARATPGGDALRIHALEVVDQAEGEAALVDAIELLGWAGTAQDVAWLEAVARSGDTALVDTAIEALGRIGTDEAVDALLPLASDDRLGSWALSALGTSGHPRAVAHLVERLDDPRTSSQAAWALARVDDPSLAPRVAAALRHARPSEVAGLAEALAAFPGDRARELLLEELDASSALRRDAALAALARAGDPMVLPLLLGDLERGTRVRQAAAAAHLGDYGDPSVADALHRAAVTGDREVQSAAVSSLGRLPGKKARERLLDLIDVGPEQAATQAVWSLPRPEDADAVAVLTQAWQRRSWNVRQAISWRLLDTPWTRGDVPDAVLALARAELADPPPGGSSGAPGFLLEHGDREDLATVEALLRDGATGTRARIVDDLAEWPGTRADQLLLAALDDPDPGVREGAVRALLRRGVDPESLEIPLIAALNEGRSQYGRVEQLLMELGTPGARAAVEARLVTGTSRERQAAIQALAWSGARDGLDVLRRHADQTEDPTERLQVVQSLLWSPDGADPELAEQLVGDDDPSLRSVGVQALANSGPAGRDRLLELARGDDPDLRRDALGALANQPGPEVEALMLDALDDPELGVNALSALAQIGSGRARAAIERVAVEHDDPNLRSTALSQLAWGGSARAPELLEAAVDDEDPNVRQTAVTALESTGSSRSAAVLAALLDDEDEDVARSAAGALQRVGGPLATDHADAIEELSEPVDDGGWAAEGLLPEGW